MEQNCSSAEWTVKFCLSSQFDRAVRQVADKADELEPLSKTARRRPKPDSLDSSFEDNMHF
jgi:hypothetical protein